MPFAIGLLVVGAVAAFFVLAPAASAAGAVASAAGDATGGSAASSGGASGSTATSTAGTGVNGQTPTGWAKDLLTSLGDPLTSANVASIVGWETLEGGNWHNTATYNPLNTTLQYKGSTNMGDSTAGANGVQAYDSWQDGLQATINTLQGGSSYSDILSALSSGKGLVGDIPGLYTWSDSYSSIPGVQ